MEEEEEEDSFSSKDVVSTTNTLVCTKISLQFRGRRRVVAVGGGVTLVKTKPTLEESVNITCATGFSEIRCPKKVVVYRSEFSQQ